MMQYDKPFRTIDEQISYLVDIHNLIIDDIDFARKTLFTLSYYDLINGYKTELMDNEKFKSGITLEYLSSLHLLDKDFQNIIFKNSMLVENIFKTKLAYVLSKNFGITISDYLSNTHYHQSKRNLNFSTVRRRFLDIYLDSNNQVLPKIRIEQPTAHYAYHHNHIPPWIILRNISFSDTTNLFCLLKSPEKQEVAELMIPIDGVSNSDKLNFVLPALNLIRKFRNVVAHNLKFINHTELRYRLPKQSLKKIIGMTVGRNHNGDVYTCVLAILVLLDSDVLRQKFIQDLKKTFMLDSSTPVRNKQLVKDYFRYSNIPEQFITQLNSILKNYELLLACANGKSDE